MEVFWEVERYQAPPDQRSSYPDRPYAASRAASLPASWTT